MKREFKMFLLDPSTFRGMLRLLLLRRQDVLFLNMVKMENGLKFLEFQE